MFQNFACCLKFWLSFCFMDASEAADFRETVGLSSDVVSGIELRAACERFRPPRRRQFCGEIAHFPSPTSPLDGLPEVDTYEEGLLILLETLHGAFLAADRAEFTSGYVLDSPFCVVAYFRDRADKEDFLDSWNIRTLGDKYVDGTAWLERIKEALRG